MKTSSTCLVSIPLLVAGSIALSGCGKTANPTTIAYRQVGICKSYVTEAGTEEKAKSDEGFAVFKIETIDNSSNGSAFYFDPQRLYVNQSDPETLKKNVYSWVRRFINPDPRIGKALAVKYIAATTIGKGEKLDDVGFWLIPLGINNPTGGPDADKYNFKVVYDTGTGDRGNIESVSEGILIQKTNPPDAAYSIIENCKELPLK
jgi:hypothetical protein